MRRDGPVTKQRRTTTGRIMALAAWGVGLAVGGAAARGQAAAPGPRVPARAGLQLPPATTAPIGGEPANKSNAPAPAEITDAQQALAERLAGDALDALQRNVPTEALWRRAAAGLEAAARLNPNEPRYPRLLAEAWTELGDADGTINALSAYRTTLRQLQMPEDQVAQTRLIELYVARMQANEPRVAYLVDVANKDTLAPEVRSYAAALAVPAVLERSLPQAIEMVRKAIALNPLNPQARQWEWELLASRGTPAEQLRSMLALIRCNPAQPELVAGVGRQLAAAGMTAEAFEWLDRALNLAERTRTPLGPEFAVEYVNQLYRTAQYPRATQFLAAGLARQPDNVDLWFMRLALGREAGGVLAYDQELAQAKRVLVDRARRAAQQTAGPTSRPAALGGGTDFLNATVRRLKEPGVPPAARAAFVAAVADLGWFELYFDRRVDEARPWVDVLAQLLPAGDVTLARLQGWLAVADGDLAQGRARLAAVRDVDPLGALGMVFLLHAEAAAGPAPATRPATNPAGADKAAQADALGKRLLTENPTGVLGMLLASALKNRNLAPDPLPAAAASRAELAQLPPGWMRITEETSATGGPEKFYLLVGQPVKLSYRLGEPMLARITLQNMTDYPLAVGPGGAVRPDLWLDGKVTLTENTVFPLAVYDKIAGVLVLPPRSSTTQVVRVNHGPMADALRERPAASMSLFMTLTTNPLSAETGVVPGPVGQKRQFVKQFIRNGAPVFAEVQKKRVYEAFNGLPSEKMGVADLLAAYVRQSRDPQPDARLVALAPEFLEQLRRLLPDAVPQAGGWAAYLLAGLKADDREALVAPLVASPQWDIRFLGLLAAEPLDPAARGRFATALAKDPDPQVQALAKAELALIAAPPVSRPPTAVRTGGTDPATTRPAGARGAPTSGTPAPAVPGAPGRLGAPPVTRPGVGGR